MASQPCLPPAKRRLEDRLLLKYAQTVNGVIYAEVIVGRGGLYDWPKGSKARALDGVHVLSAGRARKPADLIRYHRYNKRDIQNAIHGAVVEVIEVKAALNRVVIGQVIVGADLLQMAYNPKQISSVIVCEEGDPLLELVCAKRGIRVVQV